MTSRQQGLGALVAALLLMPTSEALAEQHFPHWPSGLQTDVVNLSRDFKGQMCIYVKDLSTGAQYTYNSATPTYLASGIKIPVMIALFREIKAGHVSLDDELVYAEEDLRDGAPLLSFLRVGTPVSIQILLEAMIQQSDNAATDMIIRHIGLDNVNRSLIEEGIKGFGPISTLIDVRRLAFRGIDARAAEFTTEQIFTLGTTRPLEARLNKFADLLNEPTGTFKLLDFDRAFSRYYRSGYNSAALDRMGELLEALARGKLVSPSYSQQMLEVMLRTQTGVRRVRAGLPSNTPLAHKTGTQYRRIADFAIFFMPDDRQIVFVMTVLGGKRRRAEHMIARVANRAYWHLTPPRGRRRLKRLKALDPEQIKESETADDEDLMAPALKKKLKSRLKKRKRKKRNNKSPRSGVLMKLD